MHGLQVESNNGQIRKHQPTVKSEDYRMPWRLDTIHT